MYANDILSRIHDRILLEMDILPQEFVNIILQDKCIPPIDKHEFEIYFWEM